MTTDYDVAIVGASLAGCTTATLLGRQGLRVALLEKHADPAAYKHLCGHYLQPCATPVLRRLGVTAAIERAGGLPNGADLFTGWGWVEPRPAPGETAEHGYNLRRAKLDPLLRAHAAATPGVELLPGVTATGLLDGGGVNARDRAGREHRIRTRLVVGADGRGSAVARMAGARERTSANNRVCWMAYYEGLPARKGRTALWALGRDVVIVAPNDEGLMLVAVFAHKDREPAFRADRERAFEEIVAGAPGAPDLRTARRVSKFLGYRDYPVLRRATVPRPGVALVGDAALTADPVMAIGCGWALESGAWLADAVAPALAGGEPLAGGLRRYRRRHHGALSGHARLLALAARAQPPSPVERLMVSAAARDERCARHFARFVGRTIRVRDFLSPTAIARAAWVHATA